MAEFRRFLTRAGEEWKRSRGSIDQLCAARQQLSPHPHLQDWFMAAMREALAWHCLRDRELALACLQANCPPRDLRFYADLQRIPETRDQLHSPQHEARDLRRLSKVADHSLCDLGWSRARRRQPKGALPLEQHNHGSIELPFVANCGQGSWHLPRAVRFEGQRCYTPCFASRSLLCWSVNTIFKQETCSCGRSSQWHAHPLTNS